MNTSIKSIGVAVLSAILGISSAGADVVNLVQNGSFEETVWNSGTRASYGYVVKNTTVNGSVTGWTYAPTNYVSDTYPSLTTDYGYGTTLSSEEFGKKLGDFDGQYALFIQRPGSITQTVSGLVPGETYTYSFSYNARNSTWLSKILAKAGAFTLLNNKNCYTQNSFYDYQLTFRATSETMDLSFANTNMTGNETSIADNSLLIDNVQLTLATADAPWTCSGTSDLWLSDATSKVDSSKTYSHTLNFGGSVANSATLNGVTFQGVKTAGTTDRYSISKATIYGTDGELKTIFGSSNAGSQEMANGFFHSLSDVVLTGLEPGVQYTTTFYLAAWNATNRIGYITAPDGSIFGLNENELRTENGDRAGGLLSWTGYASEDGTLKFSINAQDSGNTLHVYGVSNEVTPGQTPDSVKTNLLFATGFGGPNGNGYEGMRLTNTVADVANFITPAGSEKWQVRGYNNDPGQYSVVKDGALRMGANNANMMEIDSSLLAGKWVDLSLDLKINTLQGTEKEKVRGIGIGFSNAETIRNNTECGVGFTGLVLSPDGDLMFYENANGTSVSNAIISDSIAYLSDDGSNFDKNDWYTMNMTLEFSGDGETATLIGVGLEGSVADYSPLLGLTFDTTDLFTLLSTSSNSWDYYGLIDNVRMTEYVPEPSAWGLLALGAGSIFILRRKNRRAVTC